MLTWVAGALGVIAGAGPLMWLVARERRRYRDARRCLEYLTQAEAHDLALDGAAALPRVDRRHPWRGLVTQLAERFAEVAQRLEDAEHERAKAEVRVRRMASEQEQIAGILSGLNDPVLAINDVDELVLANSSAEQLFPEVAGATEQRALRTLVDCQTLVDLLTETRRRRGPAARTAEIELTDVLGQPHFYRLTCRSLAKADADDAERPMAGAVAVLNDISGLKAIQKRNAEFVSAVSHEMKTPLTSIKAYVELLADGDAESEEQREEFLDVINAQTDRLQRLITNLLNLARMEAGVVDVHKGARSLNALLEEAAQLIRPAAEQKRLDFRMDLSPMYLNVHADHDLMQQAAINLLSNAVKYTPEGGRVTLRSRLDEGATYFEVEDTGVGLSPEDSVKVFEKFYRVKKDQTMAPGTGLGLPLARHIVEDVHGGRLNVQSQLGKGSTFTVRLPNAGVGE